MRLPDPGRSYAVLIGTSRYASDGLDDVPHVTNNLTALKQVLTDPDLGGLPADHCQILFNEDALTVDGKLRGYAEAAKDSLLVYYAGHGLTTGRFDELFLGLPDSDRRSPRVSAYPAQTIREILGAETEATNRVLILDCCFSGRAALPHPHLSGDDDVILNQVSISGTYTLTSAPGTDPAVYDTDAAYTAFTGLLLDLLRTGLPEGPELLSLEDIYTRLRFTAQRDGLPEPQQLNSGTTATLALTRNPAHVVGEEAAPIHVGRPVPDATVEQAADPPSPPVRRPAPREPSPVTPPAPSMRFDHAMRLSQAITGLDYRARALALLAAAAEDPAQAEQLAEQAENTAQVIDSLAFRAETQTAVVAALARTDPDRAQRIAESVIDPRQRVEALVELAENNPQRAAALAGRIRHACRKVEYSRRKELPPLLIRAYPQRARKLAKEIIGAKDRARAEARMAAALADRDLAGATQIAQQALRTIDEIPGSDIDRSWIRADVAKILAPVIPERTELIAQQFYKSQKVQSLAAVAVAFTARDPERAARLADQAEGIAAELPDESRGRALLSLAQTLARSDPDRALRIMSMVETNVHVMAGTLAAIAGGMAVRNPFRASDLIAQAEAAVANTRSEDGLAALAEVVATSHPEDAERIAGTIASDNYRSRALVAVVEALLPAGPTPAQTAAVPAKGRYHLWRAIRQP